MATKRNEIVKSQDSDDLELAIATVLISQKMGMEEVERMFGVTKTFIQRAIKNKSLLASQKLINITFKDAGISHKVVPEVVPEVVPPTITKKAKEKPAPKYRAVRKNSDTQISEAIRVLQEYHDDGELTRDNRSQVIKTLMKHLSLKNEGTASTYFADAKRLAGLHYQR